MSDTVLDKCPDCGGTNLVPGDEVNDDFWDETETACLDCEYVYDAKENMHGGFNSNVAKELHDAFVEDLKNMFAVSDDEEANNQ